MARTITLGTTGIAASALGAGTWQWGDRQIWQYGKGYSRDEVAAAYTASRRAGITFFDTAEIYGSGLSETLLGGFIREDARASDVLVATKYAPLPARLSSRSI